MAGNVVEIAPYASVDLLAKRIMTVINDHPEDLNAYDIVGILETIKMAIIREKFWDEDDE